MFSGRKVFGVNRADFTDSLLGVFSKRPSLFPPMTTMKPSAPNDLTREEFETFLRAFTHEIRNRLNGITLEAADLAEQAGPGVDASRLQRQVQECSAFLKTVREMLASDSLQKEKVALAEVVKKWREQKIAESS
jgi:signal transduction histidine kinase